MKNKLTLTTLAAAAGFAGAANAQTTTIDFQTADDGYTASDTFGTSTSRFDVFNRIDDAVGGKLAGDFYWAAEDMDLSDPSLTLDTINIAGATSFTFSVDFLTPNTEDWDITDELLITYTVDGGSAQNLMWVQSIPDGDAFNAPAALDLGFDGDGDAGQELPALVDDANAGVGSNFETFSTGSIVVSGTDLDISFQFNGITSGGEGLYMDNITVTAVPEPSAYALLSGMLGLAWVMLRRRRA
jgi:hypothetical protein